jgi:DNA-directed RNA polymerase subunit RPC12/RpoP
MRTFSNADQTSSSLYSFSRSKLVLTVPLYNNGSYKTSYKHYIHYMHFTCGIIVIFFLRSSNPTSPTLTSSINNCPACGSKILKRANNSVDFPEPVLPTTPTYSSSYYMITSQFAPFLHHGFSMKHPLGHKAM